MKVLTVTGGLILASQSPRRKFLLEQAGLPFTVVVSRVNESSVAWSDPVRYTRDLALAKAGEVSDRFPDSWVIGADTIVVADEELLEKPVSRDDARRMLRRLSGRPHEVYTGFSVVQRRSGHVYGETVRSEVFFKPLSDAEIEWYVHTDEPYDKAGAYAIQGLGSFLVKAVSGSYTCVVGLPVCEVLAYLSEIGVLRREFCEADVRPTGAVHVG